MRPNPELTSKWKFSSLRHFPLLRKGWRGRLLVLLLAIAPGITAVFVSSPVPLSVRGNAGLLWALCFVPGWLYVRRLPEERRPIPFFSIIGLFYGLYYALPPALGVHSLHDFIQVVPETDYAKPVQLALWGWVLVLLGYYGIGGVLKGKAKNFRPRLSPDEAEWWGLVLLGAGVFVKLLLAVSAVPLVIAGTLNFFASLRWFGLVLLVILAGEGQISITGKLGIAAGTFLIGVLALGSGAAAQVARLGFTMAMGVWIARRHVSTQLVVGAVAVVLVVFTVRGVASQFRTEVWYGGQGRGVMGRAEVMTELVTERVEEKGVLKTIGMGSETVFGRSAALDVFADVIQRTPEHVPYWDGHTYYSLVGAFVPRFLWPEKPIKDVGNEFGQRYGYLHPKDNTTSFNLPVLIEFYINYGLFGIVIGSLILGASYRIVVHVLNVRGQSRVISGAAVTLLLPLFSIESSASITFGGLLLEGLAIFLVIKIIRIKSISGRII